MNFVFVSLQRINTDRESTSTCLAKELAKNHKVLYVNSPIDRRATLASHNDEYVTAHIEAIKNKKDTLQQLDTNLWALNPKRVIESINWVPFTPIFSLLNRLNNERLGKDIKEALEVLGFDEFILVNDKDIFRSYYLKEILQPKKYVYLDRDYTLGLDYWRKHGASLEPKLMQKSDAVVCNSHDFTKRAQKYNRNSFYIGNGFDASQYVSEKVRPIPQDLKDIPGPIIGYVGALITLRLDLALMIDLAKARPDWSFVLIGKEDDDFKASELHHLPNVYFLGLKHTKDVPAYLQGFDVCINPQILNDITNSNFPLKVIEYLAMGKPVVATSTNTMREVFQDQTYLATGSSEFISQTEKALLENSQDQQERRKDFAKEFTWENVVSVFMKSIYPELESAY
ncbi:glycosyltransferase [Rufibacter latericius]|uniref:Glycosyltransferase family 1 protein n=1 Tax=Rufibacter latericius TaxID=2487040 RepID=A0A3M9MK82_9BACT|nr:glycosyltransferase [Rufibacter latericius]RNI25605.1 glycosyltransferase family 1 protein [Rufibacter latericius]